MPAPFDYFLWRTMDQDFPCLFAKGMPHSMPHDAIFLREIDAQDAGEIAHEINSIVDAALKSPTHLVAAMCVPSWSHRVMAQTFVALSKMPSWELNLLSRIELGGKTLLPVGVHRLLRAPTPSDPPIDTVAMALGPFDTFPPSRRCPVPVFELTVDLNAVGNVKNGKLRSDFSRLPTPWIDPARHKDVRSATKTNRARVNGGSDPRAIPDNTATFSMDCAEIFTPESPTPST